MGAIEHLDDADNIGWSNDEDAEIPQGLVKPMLWRILVMPIQPKKQSTGGIVLVESARDAEAHLQFVGRLAAFGPVAFRSEKFAAGPDDLKRIAAGERVADAPNIGDWVIYPRYAGQRCEYKGTRLVLMNDDDLLARADGPSGFRIYI